MNQPVPITTEWLSVKLRVEDYLMLDDARASEAYGRTEMIEGGSGLHERAAPPACADQDPTPHQAGDRIAAAWFGTRSAGQGSVAMPPHNVPELDISVTSEPEGKGSIPPASLALVIKVADSTLRTDLGRKQRVYAREGVPDIGSSTSTAQ